MYSQSPETDLQDSDIVRAYNSSACRACGANSKETSNQSTLQRLNLSGEWRLFLTLALEWHGT